MTLIREVYLILGMGIIRIPMYHKLSMYQASLVVINAFHSLKLDQKEISSIRKCIKLNNTMKKCL